MFPSKSIWITCWAIWNRIMNNENEVCFSEEVGLVNKLTQPCIFLCLWFETWPCDVWWASGHIYTYPFWRCISLPCCLFVFFLRNVVTGIWKQVIPLLSWEFLEGLQNYSWWTKRCHLSVTSSVQQKRRSSRQVKRKRYTEDLEFRISEDDDSGDDSPAPKSPSSSQQQVQLGFLLLV